MKRRLVFSAIAGVVVAFLASYCAYIPTHVILTSDDSYRLYRDHNSLCEALSKFRVATGSFPEGLAALNLPREVSNDELPNDIDDQGNPLDPWGMPYVYERQGNSYVLQSLGSDGKPGGRGTKADVAFSADLEAQPQIGEMTYWEFMIDQPTTATALTSAFAGLCTFAIGAIGALRQKKRENEPMNQFVFMILCVSVASLAVGGMLAMEHVPIGEHH